MSDLEKFRKFFSEYGITLELCSGSDTVYCMDGDKVDIECIEGSNWLFDREGKFIKVVEGS